MERKIKLNQKKNKTRKKSEISRNETKKKDQQSASRVYNIRLQSFPVFFSSKAQNILLLLNGLCSFFHPIRNNKHIFQLLLLV